MAKFKADLPESELAQFEKLYGQSTLMMEEMTKEGAETVLENIKRNIHSSFSQGTDEIVQHFHISRAYKTPSDHGVNTKVYYSGYMVNASGKSVAAPLVINAREYGTSRGEAKKPFVRRSFKKSQITAAIKKVEERYLPHDD